MFVAAFAMLAVSTLSPPAQAAAPRATVALARRRDRPKGARVGDLYSARAKRRFASFIRMRLLELRLDALSRAASVVEHRLSIDDLLTTP